MAGLEFETDLRKDAIFRIVEDVHRLAEESLQIVRGGELPARLGDLTANMVVIAGLSGGAGDTLEKQGQFIFSKRTDIPLQPPESIEPPITPSLRPTTIAELLRESFIKVLPADRDGFSTAEIGAFVRDERAIDVVISKMGLNGRVTLNRDETIEVAQRALITPGHRFTPQEFYTRDSLYRSFVAPLRQSITRIDLWFRVIGQELGKDTHVDLSTALQVRGLARFEEYYPHLAIREKDFTN